MVGRERVVPTIESLRDSYGSEQLAIGALERRMALLQEELYAHENILHDIVGHIYALGESP